MGPDENEWFIEWLAGKLLRWVVAFVFVLGLGIVGLGLLGVGMGAFKAGIAQAAYGVILITPYLVTRRRDEGRTTVPLAGYARRLRG